VQTRKIRRLPILLFHWAFWDRVIRFEVLPEEGLIDHADLDLIRSIETVAAGPSDPRVLGRRTARRRGGAHPV
jgi:predicted Rossmann-fold nucleotide-binding protein